MQELLDKAAASGDRKASAYALILRGEFLESKAVKAEEKKAALKNGYLRVALLYKDVPDACAEALYKSMQVFKSIGQMSYATKMQEMLTTQFPDTAWALKK